MSEHQQAHRTYPSTAVANCFLALAKEDNIPLTNLKIQKLIYFANGVYLAATGVPLVDEPFQAWSYGPVLLKLYSLLRVFRNSPITIERLPTTETIDTGSQAYAIIIGVWDRLKKYTAWQLVELTHQDGSPWHKAVNKGRFAIIDNQDLMQYFSN